MNEYADAASMQAGIDKFEQPAPQSYSIEQITKELAELKEMALQVRTVAENYGDFLYGGRPQSASGNQVAPAPCGFVANTLAEIGVIRRALNGALTELQRAN